MLITILQTFKAEPRSLWTPDVSGPVRGFGRWAREEFTPMSDGGCPEQEFPPRDQKEGPALCKREHRKHRAARAFCVLLGDCQAPSALYGAVRFGEETATVERTFLVESNL